MTREPTRQVLGLRLREVLSCSTMWLCWCMPVYLGADVNVDRWDWGHDLDDTKFSFGLEAGYAFFLTRTVTIEPAAYWNINDDRSKFGLKVGFGFYF